jgi:hypothetical protein
MECGAEWGWIMQLKYNCTKNNFSKSEEEAADEVMYKISKVCKNKDKRSIHCTLLYLYFDLPWGYILTILMLIYTYPGVEH